MRNSKFSAAKFVFSVAFSVILVTFFQTSVARAETSSSLSLFSLLSPQTLQKTSQPVQPLSLWYASVNYGPVGTSVTLTGTGFSAKSSSNTVNIGKNYKIRGVSSKNTTSLNFQIPKNVKIGRYDLSVSISSSEKGINSGKTSDTVPFMVTLAGAPLPIIEKIEFPSSPTAPEATFGSPIKITGQNFTAKDNIVSTNVGIVSGIPSSDGKTLTFTLPVPDYLKKADTATRKKWFTSKGVEKDNLHWPVWARIVNVNGPSARPEASKFLINL